METKKHSGILDSVHESAQSLYDAGIIDAATISEFTALCLLHAQEFAGADAEESAEPITLRATSLRDQ